MKRYVKGANAERELIRMLWGDGFVVVRAAGSGVTQLPSPDIVAARKGRIIGFESKAWNSKHLSLSREQFESSRDWCRTAGGEFVIAWKIPKKGWLFLQPSHFARTEKNYTISLKKALRKSVNLERLLGLQAGLPFSPRAREELL